MWMVFGDRGRLNDLCEHPFIHQINFFLFFLYVKISYIICQFLTVALPPWHLIDFISMMETHEVTQISFVKIGLGNVYLLPCHFFIFMRLVDGLRRDIFAGIFFMPGFNFANWLPVDFLWVTWSLLIDRVHNVKM